MEIFQPSFRGKNLSIRKDSNGKFIEMIGVDSMLYIPIGVLPDVIYNIKVEMAKKSGNGIVFCNIYGNASHDFPHVKILCDDGSWKTYSFNAEVKSFPKTIPMSFRIWREPNGTGSVFIRKITVELIERTENLEIGIVHKENLKESQMKSILENIQETPNKPVPPQMPKPVKEARVRNTQCMRSAGDIEYFKKIPPKILDIKDGTDGIKISAVISLYNRIDHLDRTLRSFTKQTMPKEEFEIVIVDDGSTDDIYGLCKKYSEECKLQFQYVLVDSSKGAIPPASFNQALTNNIGFKNARGTVTVITGPETLLKENNFNESWKSANEGYCVYGDIYRSSASFVNFLKQNKWETLSFSDLLKVKGAMDEKGQLGGFWWYYVAVRTEHIMNINGVDEMYMKGITAEDDNFAFRMYHSGVPLIRNHSIIGIHQDHSETDGSDLHSVRLNKKEWDILRNHNVNLLNNWFVTQDPIANKDIDWGSDNTIVKKEIF